MMTEIHTLEDWIEIWNAQNLEGTICNLTSKNMVNFEGKKMMIINNYEKFIYNFEKKNSDN